MQLLGESFNAPKGGNAILMEPVRSMQKQEFGCFNAPQGDNADLTLHHKYINQSKQKLTSRSPRRCAPRDDGRVPKGGNAVLTDAVAKLNAMTESGFQCPEGR